MSVNLIEGEASGGRDVPTCFSVYGQLVAYTKRRHHYVRGVAIASTQGLIEGRDPFSVVPIRWVVMNIKSIMVEADLVSLRESYRISSDIELIILKPNEWAYFLRRGCNALHLNAFARF
ncbi:hypothetical protein Adt_35466 [Abeliophyllum distichum]|uniref:Uncharacterized protein n=1 Tax=Abeliophyllum distichum TaxID=126358 RepID=A0ABD1QET9_9LAMI